MFITPNRTEEVNRFSLLKGEGRVRVASEEKTPRHNPPKRGKAEVHRGLAAPFFVVLMVAILSVSIR